MNNLPGYRVDGDSILAEYRGRWWRVEPPEQTQRNEVKRKMLNRVRKEELEVGMKVKYGDANERTGLVTRITGYSAQVGSTGWNIEVRSDRYWGSNNKGGYLLAEQKGKRDEKSVHRVEYKPGTHIKDFVKKLLNVTKDEDAIKQLKAFQNCVLSRDVRIQVEEAITIVLRRDIFDKWGLSKHFEKGITNSILLHGPPGTGKTMIAESIAAILGKNLMILGNADIQSNIPGKTENNIQDAFKQAKQKNCVMMIDECDSLLYNRDAVGSQC